VAARVTGKPGASTDHVIFAVAQGTAEGRHQGIQQGLKMVASNDP